MVTTVSGDLDGTWGYAAELKQDHASVLERARKLSQTGRVGQVFVPNRHLDIFEHIPVHGITNGLAEKNQPENLVELKADWLKRFKEKLPGDRPVFRNPKVETEMLAKDHNFSADDLATKAELKRFLHLEAFGSEPPDDLILVTAVGRLVEQKHLGLVADIADRTLAYDGGVKFVILASAPNGDFQGKQSEIRFRILAARNPDRFFYESDFNPPLSRLILAAGDFTLIPSQFEPCGLVDYEASLLGNIVIAHRTGGLAKMEQCGYLYDWLDQADPAGEATAFFEQLRRAVDTYRNDPEWHAELVHRAMKIDASWAPSAQQYVRIYRYGLLFREWNRKRDSLLKSVDTYSKKLLEKEPLFGQLFSPVHQDLFDFRLEEAFKRDQSVE
jgi:glycosyltransferase involved in cell wall biosynthesis